MGDQSLEDELQSLIGQPVGRGEHRWLPIRSTNR